MLISDIGAVFLGLLILTGPNDEAAKLDQDELQGTWISIKGYKANGEELSEKVIKEADHKMTVRGDQLTNTMKGKSISLGITLDPSQTPKEIDKFIKEGTPPMLGIYRVKDDTLEIAWASGFGTPRPTEFVACPKDAPKKWTYGVYHREKKAP
jgi:uncharacterized protein (TIGR03067 family)